MMKNYITTSRKPGRRVRTFAKDIAFLFNAEYITRGKTSISDLIANARYNGKRFVLIVSEKDGNPKQLLVLEVNDKTWEWKEPYLLKVLATRSELYNAKNVRINDFKLETKNRMLLDLLGLLDVEENQDSECVIRDVNKGISIFYNNREIGPVFDISCVKG